MSEYNIDHVLHNMVGGPAGTTTVQVIYRSADGILMCYGTDVPSDASDGYSPGCLFLHTDGTDATAVYVNEGTGTSCDFNAITVA